MFRMCWEKKTHLSKGLCGSEPYIAPEQFEQKGQLVFPDFPLNKTVADWSLSPFVLCNRIRCPVGRRLGLGYRLLLHATPRTSLGICSKVRSNVHVLRSAIRLFGREPVELDAFSFDEPFERVQDGSEAHA